MDILTGIAVLTVGILFGIVISRFIAAHRGRTSSLAKQLDEVHAEYAHYQEQVDQHFRKTADLLNELSSNYGAIHQHLAMGVQTLSQRNLQHVASKEPKFQSTPSLANEASTTESHDSNQSVFTYTAKNSTDSEPTTKDTAPQSVTPPKDYAPKSDDSPGMLSENFSPPSAKGSPVKQSI